MTIPSLAALLPPARRGMMRRAAALLLAAALAVAVAAVPASDIPPSLPDGEAWGAVHWYGEAGG